jgi:hypothetical protein
MMAGSSMKSFEFHVSFYANLFFLQTYFNFLNSRCHEPQHFSRFPAFDWCDFVGDGKKKIGPMLKTMLRLFKTQLPAFLFSPCPIMGRAEILNFVVKNELLVFAPSGIIRFSDHWYNEKNETFLFLSLLVRIDNF